ncbi:MAG: relaxase/mobilization nuclease domain-containing protein [Nitrospira sp.]
MILKGNQRGGSKQLAAHLMKVEDNEHVEIHELRGFLSEDLHSAFHEAYAVSRGTRATQFLFSLSLNPPPNEKVPVDVFEAAIETVEQKLGLDGQPRAIVFHEKDGRRHAHAVWSRIDPEQMKAINLPFYKTKLRDVSRELFFEHGWQMPRGLVDSQDRNPCNFSHAEWEQAKRSGHDPKALKQMFQEVWASSDSKSAFMSALQMRGYTLARGDQRGFVAVDYRGEVYAIAKYAGIKTKDVRQRLGDGKDLPSVEEATNATAARMTKMLRRHVAQFEAEHLRQAVILTDRKGQVVQQQRHARERLRVSQEARWVAESAERAGRLKQGFKGLWDRLTGKRTRIRRQNELETLRCYHRDRSEKEQLFQSQLDERQTLHQHIKWTRQQHAKHVEDLHRDIASYMQMGKEPPNLQEHFREAHGPMKIAPTRSRQADLEL